MIAESSVSHKANSLCTSTSRRPVLGILVVFEQPDYLSHRTYHRLDKWVSQRLCTQALHLGMFCSISPY